jgi:hypothetical protein
VERLTTFIDEIGFIPLNDYDSIHVNEVGIFIFSTLSRMDFIPTQQPIQRCRLIFLRVKVGEAEE